jgi:hypothetical protein
MLLEDRNNFPGEPAEICRMSKSDVEPVEHVGIEPADYVAYELDRAETRQVQGGLRGIVPAQESVWLVNRR